MKETCPKVVKVIKSNLSIVRETVDKKKLIAVSGIKKREELNKTERENELKDKSGDLEDEVKEVCKVRRYK